MEQYEIFLKKCVFIDYNVSKKEIRDKLLKDNLASKICRDIINEGAIEDILNDKDIRGYIAIVNNEYVGFIFFKENYGTFYLYLIATKSKLGFPLGQILLTKIEEQARNEQAYQVQSNVLKTAINFYKKMKYDILYEEDNEYIIQKKL